MYFLDTLSRVFLITDTDSVEENMRDIHNINHRTQLLTAISDELSSKIKGPSCPNFFKPLLSHL